MQRRTFLKLAGMAPLVFAMDGVWAEGQPKIRRASGPTLILLELKGGNDGLNTLIPYQDKQYYRLRPKIGIPPANVLALENGVGMHPALQGLMPLWDAGELGWLQGVGYANPNRSHFRAIEIWDSGQLQEDDSQEGWVPPLFADKPLKGVAVDSSLGPLYADDLSTIGLINPLQFARQGRKVQPARVDSSLPALHHVLEVQDSVNELAGRFFQNLRHAPPPKQPFPKYAFGRSMEAVYQMMAAGLDIPAFKVSLTGFDTHTGQLNRQAKLLEQLAQTVSILRSNLQAIGLWDNALLLTYSEFGRRASENASGGTDHGTAAPHLLLGGRVKGGLYGRYPSLTDLDQRGDLKYSLDFRDVYASVAQHWWQRPGRTGRPVLDFVRV